MARQQEQKKRLDDLLIEFQKENPNQDKIKNIFSEFNLKYSIDPIDQMMVVLSKCSEFELKKIEKEMEPI